MSATPTDVHDNWRAPAPTATRARTLRTRAPRPRRDPDELRDATFRERWEGLTPQQQEVLRGRCAGESRAALAERLSIGESAVRNHLWQARQRLGLDGFGYAMIARVAYLLGRHDEEDRWHRAIEDARCQGRRA